MQVARRQMRKQTLKVAETAKTLDHTSHRDPGLAVDTAQIAAAPMVEDTSSTPKPLRAPRRQHSVQDTHVSVRMNGTLNGHAHKDVDGQELTQTSRSAPPHKAKQGRSLRVQTAGKAVAPSKASKLARLSTGRAEPQARSLPQSARNPISSAPPPKSPRGGRSAGKATMDLAVRVHGNSRPGKQAGSTKRGAAKSASIVKPASQRTAATSARKPAAKAARPGARSQKREYAPQTLAQTAQRSAPKVRDASATYWLAPPTPTRTRFAARLEDMTPQGAMKGLCAVLTHAIEIAHATAAHGTLARFQSPSSQEAFRPSAQGQELKPLSDEKPGATFSESGLDQSPPSNASLVSGRVGTNTASIERLEATLCEQRAALEALEKREAAALLKAQGADRAAKAAEQELHTTRLLLEEQTHINAALRSSTTWRMTAPLRKCVEYSRRLKQATLSLPRRLMARKIGESALVSNAEPATPPSDHAPGSSGITLPERLRIVAIGDGPIPSIFLGLDMPLSDIAVQHGGRFSLHYENDLPTEAILRSAHIVFMKRVCSDASVAAARFVAAQQIPLIYMLDDDFDQLDPESPLGRRYRDMNGPRNIRQICELADHVVTWTGPLAQKLRPFARRVSRFNGPSNVEIFETFPPVTRSDNQIVIGYAGGSTHGLDLEIVKPALLQILNLYPNVRVESIGLELIWLKDNPRYTHFQGKADLKEYYQLVASRGWDVGLAPLQDTAFNSAKSDNKFREYAAAGIPAVYSRTVSFTGSVRNNDNGLLCDNTTEAWLEALERMIKDSDLRARIKTSAYGDARGLLSRTSVRRQYERLIANETPPYRVVAAGPRKLATFAIDIDSPFRLLGQRHVSHIRTREIEQVNEEDLAWATTLVLVRAFEPPARDLMRRAQMLGVKVIYSWDDNWCAYPKDNSPLSKHIYAPHNQESLLDVLRGADLIKGTTEEIDRESRKHNPNVLSFPYGFDFDLSQHRPPTFRRDGRIRIGYFGTPGRDAQFNFIIEALKEVQKRHGNVDLEFFGFNPQRAPELANVHNIAYSDSYEGSVRGLMERHWDIGLAPLLDTVFNRSKLPTKYRDYAAAGAAGVYTRMTTYEHVVKNYKTGILVDNEVATWADAICRLIEDNMLRESIAREAFEHARRDLSADVAADHWEEVLRAVHRYPWRS